MSVKKMVAFAALISVVLFSCTKEDFPPQNERVQGPETVIGDDPNDDPALPIASATIHPCGYGFYVDVTYMEVPMSAEYHYEIREAGTNNVVDSGTVKHGGSTNWVLQPCTEYDFEFWGLNTTEYSTVQTASTEGCDGVFGC